MRSVIAIAIKFVGTLLASWVAFSLVDNMNWVTAVTIAAVVTVINYVLGDVFVLPGLGNFITSAVNGLLGAIMASAVVVFTTTGSVTSTSIVVFTFLIIGFEILFHAYMIRAKMAEEPNINKDYLINNSVNYNTETAKELHPYRDTDRDDINSNNNEDYHDK